MNKEIQNTAQIAHLVSEATRLRPTWYCPLLLRIGEMMIASGSYLKVHYSTQPMLRTR